MTALSTGPSAGFTGPARTVETDRVTVVVATRNRRERLLETLPHHRAATILVDNGSDDDGPDAIGAAFPDVDVVRLGENRGAAARNVGVRRASTPYVAFADDDSYWSPGSLARAADLLDTHDRMALVTATVLVGPEARLDPVSAAMAAAPLGVPPGGAGPSVLGFLSCAVVVRRADFLAAGGFQPRLFVYGEEALLAMDLAAADRQLCYVPELTVRHFPLPAGRDNGARRRIEARNRMLTALLRRPGRTVARTVAAAVRESPAAGWDVVRALPWAVRNRRPLPPGVEEALARLGH